MEQSTENKQPAQAEDKGGGNMPPSIPQGHQGGEAAEGNMWMADSRPLLAEISSLRAQLDALQAPQGGEAAPAREISEAETVALPRPVDGVEGVSKAPTFEDGVNWAIGNLISLRADLPLRDTAENHQRIMAISTKLRTVRAPHAALQARVSLLEGALQSAAAMIRRGYTTETPSILEKIEAALGSACGGPSAGEEVAHA
jgi:hypothetical protein